MKKIKKQNNRKIAGVAGVLLATTLMLQGCIQINPEDKNAKTDDSSGGQEAPSYIYPTMNYQYRTDISGVLQDITTGMSAKYLLLVNKQNPIIDQYNPKNSSYILENMVTLKDQVTKNGMELEARTARALYAMLAEMKADGIFDVKITSAYRDEDYQNRLFNNYFNQEQSKISQDAIAFFGKDYIQTNYTSKGYTKLSPEDARQVANFYSALPGQSEHHTGLCIDFITSGMVTLDDSFADTAAGRWLSQNAYRFGFILRYPKDKVDITGYSYEPWHYRFVGREAATEIYFHGQCLEEFLGTTG